VNREEEAIQAAAIAQYAVRGTSNSVLFAIPNGEKRDKATAGKLKAAGVTAGAPDLFAAANGKSFFIEVKTRTGRVQKTQDSMHKRIKNAGGLDTFVTWGLDDLLALLDDNGVLRPNRAFIGAA
jgi:hypothetical protein